VTLGELIAQLKLHPPDRKLKLGFGRPHSYRGFYECVAFESARDVTVQEMLAAAESALGATFEGYKGGLYTMSPFTDCYLAEWSCLGEELGPQLLSCMLRDEQGSVLISRAVLRRVRTALNVGLAVSVDLYNSDEQWSTRTLRNALAALPEVE
jgi:hypothetical protein